MIVEFPSGKVLDEKIGKDLGKNIRICHICGSEINLLYDDYFVSPMTKAIACVCTLHNMRWRIYELNQKIKLYKQDKIFKPKLKKSKKKRGSEK